MLPNNAQQFQCCNKILRLRRNLQSRSPTEVWKFRCRWSDTSLHIRKCFCKNSYTKESIRQSKNDWLTPPQSHDVTVTLVMTDAGLNHGILSSVSCSKARMRESYASSKSLRRHLARPPELLSRYVKITIITMWTTLVITLAFGAVFHNQFWPSWYRNYS